MYLMQTVSTGSRPRLSAANMDRRHQVEDHPPLTPEQQCSPINFNINNCGVPIQSNYYVTSPTKKFDPTKIPSKIYTEYAKPMYLNECNATPMNYIQKSPDQIVPSNIQSYLENNEPIYQNEKPEKFYELMTPQKFMKAQGSPVKSSDNFKSSYSPQVPKQPSVAVPSSPDVVKEEKKKKWSLGGLFRRRKKDDDTDSSSQDEDPKMGFLARRRSRREKRKKQAGKSTTGFDHIVKLPDKRGETSKERGGHISSPADYTMSADSLTKSPPATNMLRVKTDSRDSLGGSHDRLSSKSSRHQDSSLSRNSSGGSGSLEGLSRRERRVIIKQRAEALRKHGSSSEEDPNNVNSLHRSGSLNRRSRFARTERYIKRLSREEESVLQREAMEKQRICKSDAESGFTGSRWTPMYQDSSDNDPRYHVTSATPSPGQSPLVRHKNIVHHTNSAPMTSSSNPASLERRNHHNPNIRASKCYSVRANSPLPSNDQKPPHRQPTYDHFQYPGQKSLSYDNNIHRVTSLNTPPSPDDNVMIVQFPVARISQFQTRIGEPVTRAVKPGPPAPPPRDPQRRYTPNCIGPDSSRPMSYAFEEGSQHGFGLKKNQEGSFISLNNNQPSTTFMSAGNRSNSENQIVGQKNNFSRLQSRPRPASVTPEEMRPLPGGRHALLDQTQKTHFQYYADQTPRSRKPIHIQYQQEQPYLSDSQVVLMKPPQSRHPVSQVTEFWRQKEQETNLNNNIVRKNSGPQSRSPSPHPRDSQENIRIKGKTPGSARLGDSLSSLSGHSDLSSPVKQSDIHDSYESIGSPNSDSLRRKDQRPLSMVLESQEQTSLVMSDGGNKRQEMTPKMRYLQDCLPNIKSTYDNTVKIRPTETASVLRATMDGIAKNRPNQVAITTRLKQTYVPKTRSIIDTKSLSSPEVKSNSNQNEFNYPKLKSSTPDYASTLMRNKANNKDVIPKTKYSFHEPPITSKDFEVNGSLTISSKNAPPTPPVRRFSRQLSSSSFEATEITDDIEQRKRTSSNLEDALDELEAIYKSLKLGDEDLLDRAERRDLPTKFQLREPLPEPTYLGTSKGSMSDSGYDLSPCVVRKRAPPTRRSVIPDRVTDDMAYRRLHPKDRPNSQNIISQAGSFLLTSPVLSQASSISHGLDQEYLKPFPSDEPDITFDDVVYRNIRHVNNSLKVVEPQPLFGIPLGPVASTPSSDYLNSKPSDRYRPTFKPRRTPDVVSDDLAYRNLRKDNTKDGSLLTAVENALHNARMKDNNFSLRKRRAVRSLSANLPSLIGEDALSVININLLESNNFEKAQSLTHLPDALEIAQKILEGKEVIGGGPTHLWANENPSLDQNGMRNDRVVDRNSICTGMSTSTETLTDSRANLTLFQDSLNKRNSWQQKLRVNIPITDGHALRLPPSTTTDRKNLDPEYSRTTDCPIYEHVNGALPVPDSVPGSPLDESQLEDMLSALARDARVTSEQLEIQLAGLMKPKEDVKKIDDISDDSLDVIPNAPTQKEMSEVESVLENLYIYEPDLVDTDVENKSIEMTTESNNNSPIKSFNKSESDLLTDDYDEEIEEIFHWENNKNFDNRVNMNNNEGERIMSKSPENKTEPEPPVPKPRTNSIVHPERVEESDVAKEDAGVVVEEVCTTERKSENGASSGALGNGAAYGGGCGALQNTSTEGEEVSSKWFGQEPTNVLMACTYCIACTQQMVGLDMLTALGIILAIIALIAFLML